MVNLWDQALKRVLEVCPQGLIAAFFPHQQAHYTGIRSPEMYSLNLRADAMVEMLMNGQLLMLHMEFQVKADPTMGQRLMEYNALGARRYGCPVYSVVIYLKKHRGVLKPPYIQRFPNGIEISRFHYGMVRLWEVPCSTLLAMVEEHVCLLPLVPLTLGGTSRDMVEHVIRQLLELDEQKKGIAPDLLSLTYLLASLVLKKPKERDWLKWRFSMLEDVLRETPAYQWIKEEWLSKGIEEGKMKGIEEGKQSGIHQERQARIEGLNQVITRLVEDRFPQLLTRVQQKIAQIEQPEQLQSLLVNIGVAKNAEDVLQALEA